MSKKNDFSFIHYFYLFLFAVVFFSVSYPSTSAAQPNEADSSKQTDSFDLLLAPTSPGFVLLGIEPTTVERPGTPSDLAVTIINNTKNLSALPENFALEFLPYWLFFGKNISYSSYKANEVVPNIAQTLSLSIATSSDSETSSDTSSTSLGVGFRFSILRGRIDEKYNDYAEKLDALYDDLGKISKSITEKRSKLTEDDPTIKQLRKQLETADETMVPLIEAMLSQRHEAIDQEAEAQVREELKENYENLQSIASGLRLRRIGLKLDLAAGFVIDFPQRVFDEANFSRLGAWITGGYEWTNYSLLGVARFLGNENNSDENSFDIGGRVIFDNFKRFSLSAESVYRNFPNRDSDKNEYRVAVSFDYSLAKNKSISFTFGRDFEGRKSGNLISLINLVLGFGSERPIRN